MNRDHGFTLIELLVYVAIFAIVAGMLTSIFFVIINSQKKVSVSGEVSQQLNFVLTTVQRLVGDASLVEAVYEGQSPSSTCATFCTLKLRRGDPTKDPTFITSNANGVYLQEGSSTQVTLTTNKILVNNLKFTKNDIPGGHAVVQIATSFSYNTNNPTFAVTKAIESAIARVNAATFDADLLPNQDNTFDIGQIGSNLRWKNGGFSGDVTVGGKVGIGTTNLSNGQLDVESTLVNLAAVYGKSTSSGGSGGVFQHTGTSGNKYGVQGTANGVGALNVAGWFSAGGATSNYGIQIQNPSSGASNYAIYSDSIAQSYFAGNVGIGTASPSTLLQLGSDPAIRFIQIKTTAQPLAETGRYYFSYKAASIAASTWTDIIEFTNGGIGGNSWITLPEVAALNESGGTSSNIEYWGNRSTIRIQDGSTVSPTSTTVWVKTDELTGYNNAAINLRWDTSSGNPRIQANPGGGNNSSPVRLFGYFDMAGNRTNWSIKGF